jgi:DUF4097 and DUF4098 domain-containing protein YvlB
VGEPLVIRVAGRSSRVHVSAVAGAELHVEGGRMQHLADGAIEVSSSSSDIDIVCPEHSSVTISTASGSVRVRGVLGELHVVTASGRVQVDSAHDVEVRTASARVEIGRCNAMCRVTTQSGRIQIGQSAQVDLSSTSGRIAVGGVDTATVRTVTGRIQLATSQHATVHAQTVSGRVEIAVAGQAPARMALKSWSGRIERGVPEGDGGAHIEASSTSGAISVGRP